MHLVLAQSCYRKLSVRLCVCPSISRLLLMTNRKLHMRFPLVPKSTTLDYLEGPFCTLFQSTSFCRSSSRKFQWRLTHSAAELQVYNRRFFTERRLGWSYKMGISTMAPFKSPGTEGIFTILLQKGIRHLVYPLHSIYRASLLLGYIPKVWRTAQVAFIPKPGKLDYTTAKVFRPISLTSFLLKGMEKLVDRYLRSGPLVNLPIHPWQPVAALRQVLAGPMPCQLPLKK